MKPKIEFYFMDYAAITFFVAAAFNLMTAVSPTAVLDQPDRFFSISHRWMLFLYGGIELFTSAWLLISRNPRARLALIAWMAANLLAGRMGHHWSGEFNAGDCVGNLYDWLTISPAFMAAISWGISGILLVGSSFFLIRRGWNRGWARRKMAA